MSSRGAALALAIAMVMTAASAGARSQPADARSCDTTGTPTTTVYLPNITKTLGGPTGWVTPFIVQNVGFFATTLEVSFYRFSDGALVTCRRISGLEPGRSFADVPNNDPDLPDNSQFSVVVRSYGSEVVSVVNEQAGTGSRSEALSYVGLTSGALRVALPYVAKSVDGWLTTIVVQNLGAVETTVTATFTTFDGGSSATITRSIGPGRSRFIDPSVEASLASGVEYSVILTASRPLAAVVNAHNDAATAARPMGFSYNGVPVEAGASVHLPVLKRNVDGGRTTRVIVQNAGQAGGSASLTFARLGDGARSSVETPYLAPGRAWSLVPPSDGEHTATVGYGSFAVVAITVSDTTAMGYTASAPSPSRVYLPNVTRTLGGPSGWTTPIVVLSTADARSASLRWFRFADGRLVTQQLLSLVPGTATRVDPRAVPGLTDNTQFAVLVDARGPVTAIVEETHGGAGDGAMAYEGFPSLVEAISVPAVMTVSPSSATVALGATAQFAVTVTDQFGSPANTTAYPVSWSVSPPELGAVTSGGAFAARGYGSGKVVASAGAASAAVPVTVQSPIARPASVPTPVGYSYQTVRIARGTFGVHVVKYAIADVTVRTVTGNASDCEANCPVQPLVEYLNQTGAFAGMNGTYLCPPDYSWCAGKVNSYEYAVYNSGLGAWLNEWALVSPSNALVTVVGKTMRFYRHVYSYDRGPVDAAISNFPILLLGGAVIDTEAEQADYQRQRGTKGSIGTDGTYLYLSLVEGASVTDSAYVLQALGVLDAMNLDGGGTSALFADREYKVGPGRLLPNAVVLTRP